MSVTPAPATVATVSLAHAGLTETTIGGVRAVVPITGDMMVFGGIYEQSVTLQTSDSISPVFGPSNQLIDFQIMGGGVASQIDIYDKIFLEFTVHNGSEIAALTLPPAWYAIMSLELQVDGNTIKQYSYSQGMENMYACVAPRFEHNYTYAELGYPDAAFTAATGITIAAGVSRTFCIPIHHMFEELMHIPLKAVSSNITIRTYFQPGAGYYFSTSASTTISCTQVRMVATGQQLTDSAAQILANDVRASILKVPAIVQQVRPLTIGALTAADSGPILSNVRAATPQIRVWLYDAPITTPQSKLATVTFTSWKFLNQSGAMVNLGSLYQFETLQWTATHYGQYNVVLPQSVSSDVAGAAVLKWVDQGPALHFCKEVSPTLRNKVRHGAFSLQGYEQFIFNGTYTNGFGLAFYDCLNFLRLQNGSLVYEYQTA